ncbi:hypothetical protein ASE17_13280 [Phenylobacterium sp. Root77]|jgi:hypothetical protein|uniref:DUF6489 family protein n=1 Tax=unclassified Phenylobacterium TaxID=2640670 RepID=UPI000700F145|nr:MULTISPECIES: DUF6489 family protein [unclassified Phenylobacterium]KQW69130.1 hypothetical protein ASC73_14355 [Phenylobacterium sp. Root1277]KQW95504.1 hypothetical protein ASC79_07330 [Phenylobacterium sp. Root1290]KRC41294.1 hypothetical protein ASE17_13280 [Phenylobacterium sp. Root77]
MKMTIEIDCSPQEARAFLGLPDVTSLNDKLVEEMQKRMTSNMAMLSPDELIKNWTAFGVGAQEQFRNLMNAAVDVGMGANRSK